MSEYMPDNNNYTGFNTPMPSQDADEIKSLLKKGNVIRAITLGSVILLGGALIAMQLKNGKEICEVGSPPGSCIIFTWSVRTCGILPW